MKSIAPTIAAIVLAANLALGFRGFHREGIDFFAMKPFSDPIVRCTLQSNVPLTALYRQLPAMTFTSRLYLESLPGLAEGLAKHAQRSNPRAAVSIVCTPLHGIPNESFRAAFPPQYKDGL